MSKSPGHRDSIDPNAITEEDSPVLPVRVRAYCDCGQKGELRASGGGHSNALGEFFNHQCLKCGADVTLRKKYPCIEFRDAEAVE